MRGDDRFDYIIVGAGSAGCVLANRLSADPGNRVLLLEAGGPDRNPWIHIPVGYFKTMHDPATDWCYLTHPDPGIVGRRLQWPRGKVLGGSSSLNGLLYVRGQREDYDRWHELGNTGWSFEEVLPYFKKSEDQENGADDYHGVGGPLKVGNLRLRRSIAERFIDAAIECGIPRNDDYNGASQEGVGYFQQTAHKGFRWSTARGFLRPARRRANLAVHTRAHVTRLVFDGRRVSGIEYRRGGELRRAEVAGELILAAGAIGSPQLLECSGIGDGERLRGLGVEVVHHSPGVGEELQDHLQVRLVFKTRLRTLNDEVNNPLRKVLMALQYALTRTGPMTLAASQVAVFTRSHPSVNRPDIQFHMQPLSADKPGEGAHPFSAFTASVCQLRPESRGSVHIVSPDAGVHPRICPNYLSTPGDREAAVAGIKTARRIAGAPALREHIVEEFVPGAVYESDEELLAAARLYSQTIYHPTSTCRMGIDERAVVDPRGRVRGVEGLRVADASIMPEIVSGNTNAPAIMIGEKVSDMILEDARRRPG